MSQIEEKDVDESPIISQSKKFKETISDDKSETTQEDKQLGESSCRSILVRRRTSGSIFQYHVCCYLSLVSKL